MAQAGWDERELVRRCKEGSEAGYAELVRRHRQRLLNLAYRVLGDHAAAEDAVQETFLAAFRSMERFEPKPALAPWLSTICIREAGRTARRHTSAAAASLDNVLEADPTSPLEPISGAGHGAGADPHTAAESAELGRALTAALADLPFKQRSAVALRFVAGLDYGEAARALDVNLNTYKSLLLRGTRQLRESLGTSLELPRTDRPGALPRTDRPGALPTTDRPGALPTTDRPGALPADRPDGRRARLPADDVLPTGDDRVPVAAEPDLDPHDDDREMPTPMGPGRNVDLSEGEWPIVPPEDESSRETAEPAAIQARRPGPVRATRWDERRASN